MRRCRMVSVYGWYLVFCFVAALGARSEEQGVSEGGSADEAEASSYVWTPTIGASVGEENAQGVGDVILPIWQSSERAVFFANPRATASDNDEQEINFGLGFRGLISPDGPVLGINTYYDSRWTEHDNRFDQFGAGLEFMSDWVDVRCNIYLADEDKELIDTRNETTVSSSSTWGEMGASGHTIWQNQHTTTTTTDKRYEQFESSMSGYDAEVGVKLPYIDKYAETRLFVGYQSFDNPWGDELEGVTARLQVQPLSGLYLDAQYFDEDNLDETAYSVGVRLVLPVHSRSENQSTAQRMLTEMVMRDTKIQTTVSSFMENVAKRAVTTENSTSRETITDSASFVDGDNGSGIENGTYENPWNTIGEGVAGAFGDRIVRVDDAASTYEENVTITEGIKVYGVYAGNGGKTLGTIRPTVDGMSLGPAFTMENNTLLAGMHITNTEDPAQPPISVVIGSEVFDIERVGVFANGAGAIELDNLLVDGCYAGGMLAAVGIDVFAPVVRNSQFLNNEEFGLLIYGEGASGTFNPYVANSVFSGNGMVGFAAIGYEYDQASIRIENIVADNNFGYGVAAVLEDINGDASISVDTLQANGNFIAGLVSFAYSTGTYGNATVILDDVTTHGNTGFGIEIVAAEADGNGGNAVVEMTGISATNNGFAGIMEVYAWSDSGHAVISVTDLDASDNDGTGIVVMGAEVNTGMHANVSLANATVNRNGEDGISEVYAGTSGEDAAASIMFSNVVVSGNGLNGITEIMGATEGDDSDVLVSLLSVNTDNNGNYGIAEVGGETKGTDANVLIQVVDGTASGNANAGIYELWGDAWGTNGTVGVLLDSFAAVNNGLTGADWGYGALVKLWTAPNAGDGGIYVNNCQFSGNDEQGLWLDLQIDGGTARVFGQNNTIINNGTDGLLIGALPGSGLYSLDFGGGAEGSAGLNRIYGNDANGWGFYDVNNVGPGSLSAENNWWGTATPAAGQFSGTVDYDPWMTQAP